MGRNKEKGSHVNTWEMRSPGRRSSKCKGSEIGTHLVCSWNNRETMDVE